MKRLRKAAEKLRTDPDLQELESELVIFVQHWGLDAYDPPENVAENIRNMVAAFIADASELEPTTTQENE